MSNISTSHIRSLFLVVLMVFSVVALPAAAMTYDSETANTATVSDWQQDTTVTDLDNSSKTATIEVQSNNATSGDDFTLYVIVNDTQSEQDGKTIYTDTSAWTATNSTAGYYETNVTHSEVFELLERDAGENVTLDVKTVVNESKASEETATIQIHAQNDNDSAVSVVYGNETGTSLADSTSSRVSLSSVTFWSNDSDKPGAAKSEETVGVNATNTTEVRVEFVNASAADAGGAVTEDAESGSFIGIASANQGDSFVPMFYESADADWLDTNTDRYATIDSAGDTVTYHNVDESVDTNGNVTFTTTLNDGLGFRNANAMLKNYDVGTFDRIQLAFGANNFNGNPFEE